MKNLSKEELKKCEENFKKAENKVITNSVIKNGFLKNCENYEEIRKTQYNFSIELKQGDITNQKRSGRCWIFASTNVVRYFLIKKLNVKTFELSQSYVAFYDKLEKCNYFLNSIIKTIDRPVTDRHVMFFLDAPLNDGGQWDMFLNIIKKYGIVPKSAMPETQLSSDTTELNNILRRLLRAFSYKLRTLYRENKTMEELENEKLGMIQQIYNVLCMAYGKPPKKFDFEYKDKNDKFYSEKGMTPKDFYNKYIKELNLSDYISVINAPNKNRPYLEKYTVKYVGNVAEGNPITYLNLPINRLKEMAIAQLSEGIPVFFGSDVRKESSRNLGIMSRKLYNIQDIIQIPDIMDKATKLEYRESSMTHAMTFLGVNLDENWNGKTWKVENSWGKDAGNNGYFVLTDDWFDSYVYQVVVNKKHLKPEELEAYNKEGYYLDLEPWDPMGTLAD